MATAEQVQDQIDQNYTAFTALLPDLMKTSAGKWALLHDAALEGVFDTARDARLARDKLHPDGLFSVQQVRNRAVDLGWFSHAVYQRTVRPSRCRSLVLS